MSSSYFSVPLKLYLDILVSSMNNLWLLPKCHPMGLCSNYVWSYMFGIEVEEWTLLLWANKHNLELLGISDMLTSYVQWCTSWLIFQIILFFVAFQIFIYSSLIYGDHSFSFFLPSLFSALLSPQPETHPVFPFRKGSLPGISIKQVLSSCNKTRHPHSY